MFPIGTPLFPEKFSCKAPPRLVFVGGNGKTVNNFFD